MVEIAFKHVVRYTNNGEIGIADLGRTLIAHENLFQVLPVVLARLFPDSPVDDLRCELVRLVRESPAQEEFAGKLFVNIQTTIEEYIKGAGRATGLAVLEKHSHGISLLVILLTLLGGLYLWNRFAPGGPAPISIQGDSNVVLQAAGEALGVPSEQVRNAVETALNDRQKRQLERDAVNVFVPPKKEAGATIEYPGLHVVSPETVRDMPTPEMLEDVEPEEIYEDYERLTIVIRAINLDDNKTGWAGVAFFRASYYRLRIILPPFIDRERLMKVAVDNAIHARCVVVSRLDKNGTYVPRLIHVQSIEELEEGGKDEAERSN
jgi:hypothetical protein